MKTAKYIFADSDSQLGLAFKNKNTGILGAGHPDYTLVTVTPAGLYVLRRRSWLEKLLGLS